MDDYEWTKTCERVDCEEPSANWRDINKEYGVFLCKKCLTMEKESTNWIVYSWLGKHEWTKCLYRANPRRLNQIPRRHVDQPDMVEEITTRGNKTEMNEWESKFQRNLDLPDNQSYIAMGIESEVNTHLSGEGDDGPGWMNDRHFREHCTVYGQRLMFIHQRGKADLQPPLQFRPEWIAEKLECNFIDACTMSETWKQLGMDKKTINQMIFGYYDETNREWKDGLQYIGPTAGKKYAKYFEGLVDDVATDGADGISSIRNHFYDVSQRMIESGEWRAKYYVNSPTAWDQMKWIEYQAMVELDDDVNIVIEDEIRDELDGYIGYLGDEEPEITKEPFGINPLYDGNEGIDHELIVEIKEAGVREIKKIQQRFFNQNTHYGIRLAEYRWMSNPQKEKAWKFIRARKDQLAERTLSQQSVRLFKLLKEVDSFNIQRAMVSSYCAGNDFNLYGELIEWPSRPSDEEAFAVWQRFNRKGE